MSGRCGIILAGGAGTRLHPITLGLSKQMLPVYDKPMIYYPISTLMQAGIRDMLLISTPDDLPRFQQLLGDGKKWGVSFTYLVQPSPDGLAQALTLGSTFINNRPSALILGDNIFYGAGLTNLLAEASQETQGATVFAYQVRDPERYGVVELDAQGMAVSLAEKPANPRSNYAVTGLYFYDSEASSLARSLKPSPRGELEITDLNRLYMEQTKLRVKIMEQGYAWLDTGTYDSLIDASQFIATLDRRQGLKVSIPEEIAFRRGWITSSELEARAVALGKSGYGQYLMSVAGGKI